MYQNERRCEVPIIGSSSDQSRRVVRSSDGLARVSRSRQSAPRSGFRRVSIANDIYTSFKISVVFDDDASRLDVAYETSFFTYRDLLERFAVPLHLTLDNNLASDQVGYCLPVRT